MRADWGIVIVKGAMTVWHALMRADWGIVIVKRGLIVWPAWMRADRGIVVVKGLYRRGLQLEAMREFILSQGASKNVTLMVSADHRLHTPLHTWKSCSGSRRTPHGTSMLLQCSAVHFWRGAHFGEPVPVRPVAMNSWNP